MLSGPHFDLRTPRELDVHFPGSQVESSLDPLIATELHLDDQVVPDDPELFLPQVICRTYDPEASVRYKELRLYITSCHRRLAVSTTAACDAKPSLASMVLDLPL